MGGRRRGGLDNMVTARSGKEWRGHVVERKARRAWRWAGRGAGGCCTSMVSIPPFLPFGRPLLSRRARLMLNTTVYPQHAFDKPCQRLNRVSVIAQQKPPRSDVRRSTLSSIPLSLRTAFQRAISHRRTHPGRTLLPSRTPQLEPWSHGT